MPYNIIIQQDEFKKGDKETREAHLAYISEKNGQKYEWRLTSVMEEGKRIHRFMGKKLKLRKRESH